MRRPSDLKSISKTNDNLPESITKSDSSGSLSEYTDYINQGVNSILENMQQVNKKKYLYHHQKKLYIYIHTYIHTRYKTYCYHIKLSDRKRNVSWCDFRRESK